MLLLLEVLRTALCLRHDEPCIGCCLLMFGLIFLSAIMIDWSFKPLGSQLMALIENGSSDATEVPLRATMDATRRWVLLVYALLFVTSWLGNTKPF